VGTRMSLAIVIVATPELLPELPEQVAAVRRFTRLPFHLIIAIESAELVSSETTRPWQAEGAIVLRDEAGQGVRLRNRALFLLDAFLPAEVTILLEQGARPGVDSWENEWIAAARRFGAVHHYLAGDNGDWRQGNELHPVITQSLVGHSLAVSRLASGFVGFFDSDMRWPDSRLDYLSRLIFAGFGGVRRPDLDNNQLFFFAIGGSLKVPTAEREKKISTSLLLQSLSPQIIYAHPWGKTPSDIKKFQEITWKDSRLGGFYPGWTNNEFLPELYLDLNPDVRSAVEQFGVDPFVHFSEYGIKENRIFLPYLVENNLLPIIPEAEIETLADQCEILEDSTAFRPINEVRLEEGFADSPAKSEFLPKWKTAKIISYRLSNVFYDGDRSVLVKNNKIIKESFVYQWRPYYITAHPFIRTPVHLGHARPVIYGYNHGWQNHYHWLAQILPTIFLLFQKTPDGTVFLPNVNDVQKECLRLIGVGESSWFIARPGENYLIENMTFLNVMSGATIFDVSRAIYATFDQMIYNAGIFGPYKDDAIYISRSDVKNRKIENEDAIIEIMKENGVKILSLTGLSMRDQIHLFRDAKLIISTHGAGLSNLVFCRPGTLVYEMIPEHLQNAAFNCLAQCRGLIYWGDVFPTRDDSRDQQLGSWSAQAQERNKDWSVNLDILRRRMAEARRLLKI